MPDIEGRVVPGHQIASGLAKDSPYPDGSVALQLPYFKAAGLDLGGCYPATLNISISPRTFAVKNADLCFRNLQWIAGFPPETFSFVSCELVFESKRYPAWVYYPHPETKTQHFHNDSLLEILCEKVPGISYGSVVELILPPDKLVISA